MDIEAAEETASPALMAETGHLQVEAEGAASSLMTEETKEESDREAIELSQGAIRAVFVKIETTYNLIKHKDSKREEIHRHVVRIVLLFKLLGNL